MLQAKSGMNTTLLTEEDAEVICLVLRQWESRSGAEWKALYGTRPWKWREKYRLVRVAGREVRAYASGGDARSSGARLDPLSLVTTHERIFDDIHPIHVEGGHRKALRDVAVHNCFGGGVPRWVCDLPCETCPPVRTEAYTQGKLSWTQAHYYKGLWLARVGRCKNACPDLFSLISSICSRAQSEDEIDGVIQEVRKLWPTCKMVHGQARHSESQGGIKSLNRMVESKLGKNASGCRRTTQRAGALAE
eukprot:773805-Pleurochrysis_carterae.AAC.1